MLIKNHLLFLKLIHQIKVLNKIHWIYLINLSYIKDGLISEKLDSRNVIELFNDIKTCALEINYNFRENDCKSCDIIRNHKLQKLYK